MTSARPSVINLQQVSTPVAAPRQPQTRIGIPSGMVEDIYVFGRKAFSNPRALVLKSGNVPKAVKSADSGFRSRRVDYRSRCVPLAAVASSHGGFFISQIG
jgi:hypothetical protein